MRWSMMKTILITFSAAAFLLVVQINVIFLRNFNFKILQQDALSVDDFASRSTATVEATAARGNYYQRLKQM